MAELDRLTDLPWDILDSILGHLPIKDAVRTSILSRKWRYKWVDLSKIIVDSTRGTISFKNWDQLTKFLYFYLLAHRGQIDTFMISSRFCGDGEDVDEWIDFLSGKGIKKLVLDVDCGYDYELSDSLFSCQQLTCLFIHDCYVIPPSTFNGFSQLVRLQLERCVIDKEILERLISNCPILETFILSDFCEVEFDSLNIDAPNLKSLCLEGKFMKVYLENSPYLTDLSIEMTTDLDMIQDPAPLISFVSHLKRLSLVAHFLRGFPVACDNLTVLELLDVYFNELAEIAAFISLLRNSPNLKALCISVSGPYERDVYTFMTAQNHLSFSFKELQYVKIQISACLPEEDKTQCFRSDLQFIKLVLARSPILEKMLVYYQPPEGLDKWFMSELLSFKRASSNLIFKYISTPSPEEYWPRHYDGW